MILQSLVRYYDILSKDSDSDIARPGYSSVGVSFALNISAQGELLDVLSLLVSEQRGKKNVEVTRRMIVPEQIKKTSGISTNFLCENSAYVLGISGKESNDPDFGINRFKAFRQFHKDLLAKADCNAARAVQAFLDGYNPLKGRELPVIAGSLEALLKGGNLVFIFQGVFVQEDPTIRAVWEAYKAGKDVVLGQCLVTGETAPIARLHASLRGIRGANPTGASLVGFNARAYKSYNRVNGQGLNSPVSEKATFAYTTMLNYLLSSTNSNRKFTIGDTTVVYWAESDKKEFVDVFAGIFEPPIVEEEIAAGSSGRKKAEKGLRDVANKVKRVQRLDLDALIKDLEGENPQFYVLGLAPNAARVSVRFFLSDPFDKIVERMMLHYSDLEMVKEFDNQPAYITVHQILDETVSRKASDQAASPLLAGALFRSILTGAPYPAGLYFAILNRIRTDVDGKGVQKISYTRAAIVKAFLLRKYRDQPQNKIQEVLSMSLNDQSNIPAYVLGRLFAVLEKVQQEAIGSMNASIKDRYFTSACATPANVFPVLLRLSQHHIAKAEYGYASDKRIEDLLNLLEVDKHPFPAHLSLDEQGTFVLGYYHQRAAFYVSKADRNPVEVTSGEIKS